jgi:hypothetical protein
LDWFAFLVSVLTSSIVTLIINSVIKGGIKHQYSKRLEKFKSDLSLISEDQKFDFQRKIHDFSIYSSRRQEIYPEMYKYIYKLHKEINLIEELSFLSPAFISEKERIVPYFNGIGIEFTEEEVKLILKKYDSYDTHEDSLINLSDLIKQILINEFNKKIKAADDFFQDHILYFSNDSIKKINNFLTNILVLVVNMKLEDNDDKNEILKEVSDCCKEIEEILKAALTKGDYY